MPVSDVTPLCRVWLQPWAVPSRRVKLWALTQHALHARHFHGRLTALALFGSQNPPGLFLTLISFCGRGNQGTRRLDSVSRVTLLIGDGARFDPRNSGFRVST